MQGTRQNQRNSSIFQRCLVGGSDQGVQVTYPGEYHTPIVCGPMPYDPKPTYKSRGDENCSRDEGGSGDDKYGPAAGMEALFDCIHFTARVRDFGF